MIKFIENDFKRVTEALNYLANRKVPFGICLLYYMVAGLLALPTIPFIWIWYKITMYRIWRQTRD